MAATRSRFCTALGCLSLAPPVPKEAVADEYGGDQDQLLDGLDRSLSVLQRRAREEEIPTDELCNNGEVCMLFLLQELLKACCHAG